MPFEVSKTIVSAVASTMISNGDSVSAEQTYQVPQQQVCYQYAIPVRTMFGLRTRYEYQTYCYDQPVVQHYYHYYPGSIR